MRKSIVVLIVIAAVVVMVAAILTLGLENESDSCKGWIWICLMFLLPLYFSFILIPLGLVLVLIGAIPLLYAKIRKKVLRHLLVYIFRTLIILGFLILAPFLFQGYVRITEIQHDRQQREYLQERTFQLYKPTYLPSGYSTLEFSYNTYMYFNQENFNSEDKIFTTYISPKYEDRSSSTVPGWHIYQVKLNRPFPAKCPDFLYSYSEQERFNLECVLVTTTPKGHKIYKSEDVGYDSFLAVDNTLFILGRSALDVDLVELTKIVDSLAPLNPADVELTDVYRN